MKRNKEKNFINDLSFQNRLLLSYSLIVAVIMVCGMFLYQISYRQVKTGIDKQNATMMTASIRRLDNTMSSINMVAQLVSGNSFFAVLAGQNPESTDFYYNAYKTQQALKSVFPLEHMLSTSDTFIYMRNSGYIISPSEFLSFKSYANYRLLCPPDMTQKIEDILVSQNNRNRFIPLEEFDSRRTGYIYFYPLANGNTFSEKNIQSYLCCVFDRDMMESFFSGLLPQKGTITAVDSAGNEKLSLSAGSVSKSDGNILSTAVSSAYNNWLYVLRQPEVLAYYSINRYRNIFALITLLVFLVECLIVYFFSVINSKPVARLSDELGVKEELASSLGKMVEKHRPLVLESYMRRIMEGSITTDDEMAYITNELHLNHPNTKYQVLYIEVYPSEDFSVQLDDMPLCLQNYDVLVRDALKRHFPDTGYLYKPSDRFFSVLLASCGSLSHDQVMLHNFREFSSFHAELLTQYGIWSRGGFGGRNGKLSNTWKSFQQAKDAKSITTVEHFVQSYDDFVHSNDVYYYPEIMSMQLAGAVSAGNREQVTEIFRLISRENTVSRILPRPQHQQLLSDIRSTLFKKRYALPAKADSNAEIFNQQLDLIDHQFEGEISLDILKEIALGLCGLFPAPQNSPNELILRIQNYITENYHNPSLCLTKISDEFNISENYFSFLFKKEVHENFSDYLESLRMAKAKELVLRSDTMLSDLYQYLGYNNAASFRRVFKKTFGISPKEMREQSYAE